MGLHLCTRWWNGTPKHNFLIFLLRVISLTFWRKPRVRKYHFTILASISIFKDNYIYMSEILYVRIFPTFLWTNQWKNQAAGVLDPRKKMWKQSSSSHWVRIGGTMHSENFQSIWSIHFILQYVGWMCHAGFALSSDLPWGYCLYLHFPSISAFCDVNKASFSAPLSEKEEQERARRSRGI